MRKRNKWMSKELSDLVKKEINKVKEINNLKDKLKFNRNYKKITKEKKLKYKILKHKVDFYEFIQLILNLAIEFQGEKSNGLKPRKNKK